jgi:hypothetical protein
MSCIINHEAIVLIYFIEQIDSPPNGLIEKGTKLNPAKTMTTPKKRMISIGTLSCYKECLETMHRYHGTYLCGMKNGKYSHIFKGFRGPDGEVAETKLQKNKRI